MDRPHILLTNDDGIESPGLWAAAKTLSEIGFVHVVAPREQFSGSGRSMSRTADGIIQSKPMHVNGKDWTVYAVGGTPAQVVLHAVLEILPELPDLVVSGINYGENLGNSITVSGTIGAALEASSLGIPALAISQETDPSLHFTHSEEVDFTPASYYTRLFGEMLISRSLPDDVNVLKVDVPSGASTDTPWVITRLSRENYFKPIAPERNTWDETGRVGYERVEFPPEEDENTDVYAVRVKRKVSVTPLSLDLTSRIDLGELDNLLRSEGSAE